MLARSILCLRVLLARFRFVCLRVLKPPKVLLLLLRGAALVGSAPILDLARNWLSVDAPFLDFTTSSYILLLFGTVTNIPPRPFFLVIAPFGNPLLVNVLFCNGFRFDATPLLNDLNF
jgi:hypothetical protein